MLAEDRIRAATDGVFEIARECRNDPGRAFEFAMRDDERRPMRLAPHQELGLHFAVHHPRCVLRWAIDTGKSTIARFLALYLLGHDETERVLFASKTEDIAKKNVAVCRDYLSTGLGAHFRLMFPHLRRSRRATDPWTATELTVERPPGFADASMKAIGLEGSTQSAKVTTIVADDLLDLDNTRTRATRKKTSEQFNAQILNRLLPVPQARCVFINVSWEKNVGDDPGDLTYELERDRGWPTLTMGLSGDVRISNAADDYDTDLVREGARKKAVYYRLVAHDPDPEERQTLDPSRYSIAKRDEIRADTLPHIYAAQRECDPRSRSDARCKEEWIETAKRAGRGLVMRGNLEQLAVELGYRPPIFTGVDCGIDEERDHDRSSIFSFAFLQDERRRVVEVSSGRWDGPELLDRVIDTLDRWDSIAAVESNAAQKWLLQFGRKKRKSLRVAAHFTSKANKHARQFGLEGVFLELQQGLWVIPCSENLVASSEVEEALEACRSYQPPPAHTPDELMAWWIAAEKARKMGFGRGSGGTAGGSRRERRSPVRTGGTF